GQVQEFDGDLEDYRDWLTARAASARAEARNEAQGENAATPSVDRKAQRRHEAEERQRIALLRKPLDGKLKKVEADMEAASRRLKELDALIADPEFYSDARRDERLKVLAEHGELGKKHGMLEEHGLELQE